MTQPQPQQQDKEQEEEKQEQQQMEQELIEKLPDQAPPAQEWGERHATGKTIATGGTMHADEEEKEK